MCAARNRPTTVALPAMVVSHGQPDAATADKSLKAAGNFLKVCESRRMSKPVNTFYEFDAFRVDAQKRLLLRDGDAVPLTPKAFDILLALLERHGEVLSKEELMQAVWPDVAVEENNLTRNISTLRKALGEKPDEHRYVVTLPGSGYRFVAAVSEGAMAHESQIVDAERNVVAGAVETPVVLPRQSRAFRLGALALLVLATVVAVYGWFWRERRPAAITSLAVLPLANLSGDPQQEYFADGMTDALTGDLARISALRVISRTSAMQYKGTQKRLSEIARELNVDAVIEGTVQRSSERLFIRAQLIHAASDQHLWAATYERDLRDVLKVQSEVAQAIAREINVVVTPQEQARLARVRQVTPQAYETYLKARYIWNKRTPATLKTAVEHFQQAIELDPNYAPSHAGLADAYSMLSDYAVARPHEAYPKAKEAVLKALVLDAELAEAHTSLAWILAAYEWKFAEAEQSFQRALALNPNYATARQWHSEFLSALGRHAEAIAESERAQQLEPFSLILNTARAEAYYLARQYDQVIAQCQNTIELDPNFGEAYSMLARAYAAKGMPRAALAAHHKHMELMGWTPAVKLQAPGAMNNMPAYWRQRLDEERQTTQPFPLWMAESSAQLGDRRQALQWLEKLCQERNYWAMYLNVVPTLDPLRGDPHFQDLLRRIGLAQ
jgi:TolB-like protein/DNA-binding winged helix-turn-helix (wHTH) protein/cytochrome c-type biogenesis protein CcmH/NrfG